MQVIIVLALTIVSGLLLIPLVIRVIKKNNIMDLPGGRKIHKQSVPSMGGLGIMLAFAAGAAYILQGESLHSHYAIMVALGLLTLIGFWDDKMDMSAMHKLIGQLSAFSILVILGDIRIHSFFGLLGIYELPLIFSYALSIFMFVGLTNAYNLIDGLDGLAGTLGLISCNFLGVWFLYAGYKVEGLLCLAMFGGILAFLVYNWHPAKIFMGDTGSLPIGCFITTLTIIFINANGALPIESTYKFHAPIASGLSLMIVCTYDTLRVFIRRIRRGKSPFSPDKSHIHHFLMRMGHDHDQVAMLLGGVKLLFLGLVIACSNMSDHIMLPTIFVLAIASGGLINVVTLRKVRAKVRKTPPISQRMSLQLSTEDPRSRGDNWEKEAILER